MLFFRVFFLVQRNVLYNRNWIISYYLKLINVESGENLHFTEIFEIWRVVIVVGSTSNVTKLNFEVTFKVTYNVKNIFELFFHKFNAFIT